MIDKVEFTAKNLTSNAGVLLLFNYTSVGYYINTRDSFIRDITKR